MQHWISRTIMTVMFWIMAFPVTMTVASESADPGWPRLLQADGRELLIYQPQVDSWTDYRVLHFRCAISIKTSKSAKERFGVAEITAETVVDQANRVVALLPKTRELRFPNTSDSEEKSLRQAVDKLHPPGQPLTLSLDRVLVYIDPARQQQQQAIQLNLDPPRIFFSNQPAILLMFQGDPQLQPVVKNTPDLMFAVNANWPVFYDATMQQYFLLNGDSWLLATDALRGPWLPAGNLPRGLSSLPPDENWAEVRKHVPGKQVSRPPAVFISAEPAELILTQGDPVYSPVAGTGLMRLTNTESALFLHTGDRQHYLLVAGRWFRAASLEGPWSGASTDLPADFARIPDDNPAAFVKSSIPGTTEAKDAVMLASIPTKTVITTNDPPPVQVTYVGQPQFQVIETTPVKYAINSPNAVFLANGSYYCCYAGVWYESGTATGPWTLCTSVPSVIYTIPPSHPTHNVTYVVVQSSSPTTVVYTQTAGYSGEYVAATGVLMFGAGMMAGAMIADSHHQHYYPTPYSYGWGARYDYHHGGYYRAGNVAYGPYAGGGSHVAYNPRTGTYSRGAYAYGPGGSAATRQAYNPYTGTRAAATRVDTAYGSAGRAAAYNPQTGNAARGGYRSNDRGTAAAVQTNRGTGAVGVRSSSGGGAAAWDTRNGQGAAVKDKEGNVYAGKDGNVYKRDNSGNWSSNTGSGWQSTNRPQSTRELNGQAGSRSRGNQMQRRSR